MGEGNNYTWWSRPKSILLISTFLAHSTSWLNPPVVQSKVVHVLNCESVIQTLSCDLMSVFHPDKWMLSSFSVFFWCRNDKWCKFTIQHRPLSVWVTDWYWRCVCRLEIYHGSPRALYFMDEPIECKLFLSNSLSLSPFCLPKAIQSLWSI